MKIPNIVRRAADALLPVYPAIPALLDIDAGDLDFISRFDNYTMTSLERRYHLLNSVRHIIRHRIRGSIVECGVWRGGSMMLVANALLSMNAADRDIYLFDTFAGMPPPTQIDEDFAGRKAADRLRGDVVRKEDSVIWAIASLSDVSSNMAETGYPENLVHYTVGRVEETLPEWAPPCISLLRLDTDWYQSTRHELSHLYPRVVSGGVIIIDDYGYWKGAKKAVDEFLASIPDPLLLHRIDDTCRALVKP